MTDTAASTENLKLDAVREFDAPKKLVYQAWTDGDLMMRWSAPHGFIVTDSTGDLRSGGEWRAAMRTPTGEELRLGGIYQEIVPNERLVFTHRWQEREGEPSIATLVTITFRDAGAGGSRMEFHQEGFKSPESRDGHRGGWEECFDGLAELLAELSCPAEREVVSTRRFDAPIERVFRAYTEAEHLARWWGPKGFRNTVEHFDLRPGGYWRFVMHGPDGTDYPNEILFREIVTRKRIVFDHLGGHLFHVCIDFAEETGGTRVTFRMQFPSAEHTAKIRDFVTNANEENFERLEAELIRMEQLEAAAQ